MAAGEIREASGTRSRVGKKLHHIEIMPGKRGGAVVTHHYHSDGMHFHEPDIFPMGKGPEVVHHLMDHLGVKENEMMDHLHGENEKNEPEPKGNKTKAAPARSEAEEEGDD